MEKARSIVVGNKVYRALLDETVTDEDVRKAEVELNETPESRVVALTVLKELLKEQTDFIPRTDDGYLLRFLRVRKFDVERSFKLIEEHYKYRAKYSEVFPAVSTVEKVLKANIFNYLPHRDSKGRAIFVVKIANWNPDEIPYPEFVAAGYLISEYILDNPVTQVNGYVGIWDFKGFNLKQFMVFCSPKNITLLTSLMQDRFPGRFKVAYCVNCPYLVTTTWNLFKNVLKEKFRKRIKMDTSDMKILHQNIDKNILPKEYRGMMPPSDCKEMAQRVLQNEQYFNYNRKFGYDPSEFHNV